MFNYFNLSSDLMEPFRPLIDKTVLKMPLEQFEHQEKLQLYQAIYAKDFAQQTDENRTLYIHKMILLK